MMKLIEVLIVGFMGSLLLYFLVCLIFLFIMWFKMGRLTLRLKREGKLGKIQTYKNMVKNLFSLKIMIKGGSPYAWVFSKEKFNSIFNKEWNYKYFKKDKELSQMIVSLRKTTRLYFLLIEIALLFFLISVPLSILLSFIFN